MDRENSHKRHGKHKSGKKHKKKRDRSNSGSAELNCNSPSSSVKPLVEYSDVSSEDLSAPEAGEIQSDDSTAKSTGFPERASERRRKSHRYSPFTQGSSSTVLRRDNHDGVVKHRRPDVESRNSTAVDYDVMNTRVKHKKERKHKERKKQKKKSKHKSRSVSLDSLSVEGMCTSPSEMRRRTSGEMYENVPDNWDRKSSSKKRFEKNGSCSPISSLTPPMSSAKPPLRRLTNASDISHNTYSPPRTPLLNTPSR